MTPEEQNVRALHLPMGRRVGAYEVLGLIGVGGMGEVYRARDTRLRRDVALKTLPAVVASDPRWLELFRREARTLASLNHPNIAAIYGLEEFEGTTCLVLELVEGETLSGPTPIDVALDHASQIADALAAAHERHIVHRDLKPANVKVTREGRVKVLDFGIAKALRTADEPQPSTSLANPGSATEVLGTLEYMSPEQAHGNNVDARCDIWAFGCVLYEMLTGAKASRGTTPAATLAAILQREPDWKVLPADMPKSLRALLISCLEKDPSRRIADIREARDSIRRHLDVIPGTGFGRVHPGLEVRSTVWRRAAQ